ncbi:unnamed protein product, partial [Anisakis simplex]|uniref:Uncharacterized protein n=1 Tax=Anisakis simplex TaxID=6269 RepID=A0A0M3JAM6_ANISI
MILATIEVETPYDGEKPEKRLNRSVSMNDDASNNVINHRNSVSKCNDRKKSATLMIPRSPAETLHSEAGNLEPKQEQCMSLDAESTSNEASSTVASSMTTTSTSSCYIPAQPSGTLSPPVAPPSSLSTLSVSIPRSAVHQMRSSTRADRRKSSHSYDDQLQLQLQQQQQQSDCQLGDDEKPRKRR